MRIRHTRRAVAARTGIRHRLAGMTQTPYRWNAGYHILPKKGEQTKKRHFAASGFSSWIPARVRMYSANTESLRPGGGQTMGKDCQEQRKGRGEESVPRAAFALLLFVGVKPTTGAQTGARRREPPPAGPARQPKPGRAAGSDRVLLPSLRAYRRPGRIVRSCRAAG